MDLPRSRRSRVRCLRLAYALAVAAAPLATACSSDRSDPVSPTPIIPACASPAPLVGTYDSLAPDYILTTRANSDLGAVAARLTTQYGIRVIHVYASIGGLNLDATPKQVAQLRCDADVELIAFDGVVHANGR